ncbi:EamA family transporter [Halovenus sp. WSH3]|uniref:EamA family transporter n=1 Tax=Halovenus carboxidivorans TaxID=2692199 RepID=A0A6B0T5M7_9EURY|nr:DMT family transporter [Halovenus carboxidivorans]MXR50863.1 EamA family transporter [Halovenus carboxidivorans]
MRRLCAAVAAVRAGNGLAPVAGLAVSICAISTGAILVRLSSAPSSVAAMYRVLFTTLPLLPVAALRYREQFRAMDRRDLLFACASGLALAVHFASWFESLAWTSVAASVTLVQSQPLFVAVGAWALLSERVSRRVAAGILVAVAGIVTMSLSDLVGGVVGANPLLGNALALLGAVMAAGYVLAGRSLRQRMALIPYVVVVYSVCTVGLFALVVSQGHALGGYPRGEWLVFAGLALGPGLFGHTVINWALGHLESSVVSVSLLGEPIGATLLAALLLGETPSMLTVLGGAVVLAGIVTTATARDRQSADGPSDAAS